jgi:hypothetical protein
MSKATRTRVVTSDVINSEPTTAEETTVKPDAAAKKLATLVDRIAAARETYGTPKEVTDAGTAAKAQVDAAKVTLKQSETGLRAWVTLASQHAVLVPNGGREFGRLSGGNPNTRTRLARTADILAAAKDAGKPVPFWDAVKDGNAHSAKRAEFVVAELANGRNPYEEPAEGEGEGNGGTTAPPRRVKSYKVADAAEIVRTLTTAVKSDETLTDEQWRDLYRAASAFTLAVGKRAGVKSTTRAPRAAKVAA